MKRKILIGIGLFLGLFIIAALITPFLMDINVYRPKLKAILEEKLNAQVELGEMQLTLIKGLTAQVDGLKLSNPVGFKQDNLLQVDKVHVSFGALKSLFGSPHITIHLSNAEINIYQNKKDELNIQKLLKEPSTNIDNNTSAESAAPKGIKATGGIVGYFVSNASVTVSLKNTQMNYYKKDGSQNNISNLNVRLGPVNATSKIPLELSGVLGEFKSKHFALSGPFDFSLTSSNPIQSPKQHKLDMIAKLDGMSIQTPWYKKDSSEPLSISLLGTYFKDQFNIEMLKLKYPMGRLDVLESVADLKKKTFQTNLKFSLKTPTENKNKDLTFRSDLKLDLKAKGTLTPFVLSTGKGNIDVRHLSGDVPPFLKAFMLNQHISAKGHGSVKFKGAFDIENNKPSRVEFENVEVDLTPLLLNYQKKWEKEPGKKLSLVLSGTMDMRGKKKDLTLKSSSIHFDNVALDVSGHLSLGETPHLSLSLSTNHFAPSALKTYLPILPFDFRGNMKATDIQLTGNPQKLSSLEIKGRIIIPKDTLVINQAYFKEQKWQAIGPILFSLDSVFHVKNKKLTFLELASYSDFTDASLSLENKFTKSAKKILTLEVAARLKEDTLSFSKANFNFHNLKASLHGNMQNFSKKDKRTCNVTINAKPFVLDEWNAFFPTIKNKFRGNAEFKSVKLSFPTSKPKDLSIIGKMHLNNISGELPKGFIKSKTLNLSGPFSLNLLSDLHYSKSSIKKMHLDGKIDLSKMAIFKKGTLNKPTNIPLTIDLKVKSKKEVVLIDAVKILLKGLALNITGEISSLKKNPLFKVQLVSSQFSLKQLSSLIPSLKDKNISGNFKFGVQFKGSPQNSKSPLDFKFAITSDKIAYLPPPAQLDKIKKVDKEKEKDKKEKEKRESWMKRVNASGDVIINHLQYKTYELKNLKAKLAVAKNITKLIPLKFDLYGGRFKATGTLDQRGASPIIRVDSQLKEIDLEKYLRSQKSTLLNKLSGSLDTDLKLAFQGFEWDRIKDSLNAKGKITIREGHFKVFNLTSVIGSLPILSQVAPDVELSDRFSILQSSLYVKNQTLITPDIYLQGKSHLLKTEGTATFAGKLNYKGSYYLSKEVDFKREIPFTVTGTVNSPLPLPDIGKLLQNKVQGVFEKILTPKSKGQDHPKDTEGNDGGLIEDIIKDNLPF